jgi:hypothetical protein
MPLLGMVLKCLFFCACTCTCICIQADSSEAEAGSFVVGFSLDFIGDFIYQDRYISDLIQLLPVLWE